MHLRTQLRAQASVVRTLSMALVLCALALVARPSSAFALPAYFDGDENAFYTLPTAAQIPAGGAGTIVRWQRYDPSGILTYNADPLVAYRVLYKTTDPFTNALKIVSGTVIFPVRVAFNTGSRPIVAFATGTQGMADRCAAVHGIANSTNYDLAYMRPALDKGWVLAITDYQGLGLNTPNDEHPEIVGQILGRNVLDSVRGVSQLVPDFDAYRKAHWPLKTAIWANISSSSKVVAWGYSEGGGAAAWAGELQPSYAPEIRLVGVAAGGIPADPLAVGQAINTVGSKQNLSFGILVGAAIGFKAAYPNLTFDTRLTDGSTTLKGRSELNNAITNGVSVASDVKNQCLVELLIGNNNFAGKTIEQYINQDGPYFSPLTDLSWLAAFEQNKLGKVAQPMPVYLYHAHDDEAVEYCQARRLAKAYCDKNVWVTWKRFEGEHALGWAQGLQPSIDFIDARIGGGAPANSCNDLLVTDPGCP